jgi:hypothetical protein
MDDEHTLREADARVRRALWPDDAVTRRVLDVLDVLDRAIADERAPRRRARRFQSAVVFAAALILCVTGVIVWQSRHAPSAPGPASSDSLAVTGTDRSSSSNIRTAGAGSSGRRRSVARAATTSSWQK